MIGYLKGKIKIISKIYSYLILDCSGVGYKIELGQKKLKLRANQECEFFVYTNVRENELRLFGFETIKELEIFEMLLDVSGVGPKVALNLVSNLGAEKVITSILKKDSQELKTKGVGIKTADKIVLELRDKLKNKGFRGSGKVRSSPMKNEQFLRKLEQAKDALRSLGYSTSDIKRIIELSKFDKEVTMMSIEQLVKYLLSQM